MTGGLIGEFLVKGSPFSPFFSHQLSSVPYGDAGGIIIDHRCFLAHNPITSHCGRITLVLRGFIYNHKQVRKALRFKGWISHSDVETLVEGLAQRGPAILLDLRGMFAFAAYDRDKEQLLLARDRLGTKPLYLSWQSHGLLFASDRRALPYCHRLEPQAISQILSFGHDRTPAEFPGPDTHGIVSLPAGLVVRINHSRPHDPVRYWPPQPRPDWSPLPIRNRLRARTFLRQQLEQVVAQHLQGVRSIACLLSPGINSGVLASLACRLQPGEISTVSVALPGSLQHETTLPRQLAGHCGSQHHELVLNEDVALAWVEQGLNNLDMPTADGINTYLISRCVADEGIKVALSGLGAAALFGGSFSHRMIPWLQLLRWLPPQIRHRLLQRLSPRFAHKLSGLPHWDHWHLGLGLRRWCSEQDLLAAGSVPLQFPESASQRITEAWGQISWSELFGYIEPLLLRDADHIGMAVGLEIGFPFLDHRLVEIALRMPEHFHRNSNGLLLQACADLLPIGYENHRKSSFPLPMADWMRGPLHQVCTARLDSLRQSGWLHPDWISQQWHLFEFNQLNWRLAWTLVVLGEFAQRRSTP